MSAQTTAVISRAIQAVAGGGVHFLTDRELLRRFAETGDQTAFATLFRRHSAMVHGVCRRSLPTVQDAEDACQAVFLLLARKAKSNHWHNSAANWLYSTARRVAWNARRAARRRAQREAKSASSATAQPVDQMSGREMLALLDEELQRLPSIYREVLVLCCLEGLARDEAAARLAVPLATLKTRLERGRKRLGEALTKRGVELGAGLLALAAVTPASTGSPMLAEEMLKAVTGKASPAAALLKGAAVKGLLAQAKVALLMLVGVTALGLGFAAVQPIVAARSETADKSTKKKSDVPAAKVSVERPIAGEERSFTGTVVDAGGKPVAAELFQATAQKLKLLGRADAEGRFRINAPTGHEGLFLIAKADGHAIDFLDCNADTPSEIRFKLPKEQVIRGRIVDTQGRPIPDVAVSFMRLIVFGNGSIDPFLKVWKNRSDVQDYYGIQHDVKTLVLLKEQLIEVRTDMNGRFELGGFGVEQFVEVWMHRHGIADAYASVVTRPGFDPEPYNIITTNSAFRFDPPPLFAGVQGLALSNDILSGPEFHVVAEPEKIIRGRLKDAKNGERATGVLVWLDQSAGHCRTRAEATTDSVGRFELRGVRKSRTYHLNSYVHEQNGWLPVEHVIADTGGYDPIEVEVGCRKGVIVTGTIRDKSTRLPIPAEIGVVMLHNNRVARTACPAGGLNGPDKYYSGADGRFRAVIVPGPVLLVASAGRSTSDLAVEKTYAAQPAGFETLSARMYRALSADPDHIGEFTIRNGVTSVVDIYGQTVPLHGNWCKVIDGNLDDVITQNIELEPTTRQIVRVIDTEGRPVKGFFAASDAPTKSLTPVELRRCTSDSFALYDLQPNERRFVVVGHPKRRLVGTFKAKADDKEPCVQLGPGGVVAGRVVDGEGKPVKGVSVFLMYARKEADGVYQKINGDASVQTDDDGRFRCDCVIPGESFWFGFAVGSTYYDHDTLWPYFHGVKNHGSTRELGDLRMDMKHPRQQ